MAAKNSLREKQEDLPISFSCGNVFEDLGFEPEEAKILQNDVLLELQHRNKIKRVMVSLINEEIARRRLNLTEAAQALKISRPRLSDIAHAKVEKFSTDSAVDLLWRLGKAVQLVVEPAHAQVQSAAVGMQLSMNSDAKPMSAAKVSKATTMGEAKGGSKRPKRIVA